MIKYLLSKIQLTSPKLTFSSNYKAQIHFFRIACDDISVIMCANLVFGWDISKFLKNLIVVKNLNFTLRLYGTATCFISIILFEVSRPQIWDL